LRLRELTDSARRLALVGLAKNTGKTVALTALLSELQADALPIGVTSVGRDGEEHDVIDFRIEKPRVHLPGGSIVATTDELLRASALPHDLLEQTDVRTPLGRVLIARLRGAGTVEVAGPSAAADVRRVSDAMLGHGAEQVLIDGAIDRRAASSPDVADGLVIATGAILSREISEVVAKTVDAVALVRLPQLSSDTTEGARLRELANSRQGALVDDALDAHPLPPRFFLAEPPVVEGFLREGIPPRWLIVPGALPEAFLNVLVGFVRRGRRPLTIVVSDPTKVFLSAHGIDFYDRAGIAIETLAPISLRAITVNPVAPQSHSFDSAALRGLLREAIPDVPIFDVLHPDYRGAGQPASA